MGPPLDRQISLAGFAEMPKLAGPLIGFMTLLLLVFSLLLYLDARELAPEMPSA